MRKYILYAAWIGLIIYLKSLTTWFGVACAVLSASLLGLGVLALVSVFFQPAKRASWRVYSDVWLDDNGNQIKAFPTLYRISRILNAGYVPVTDTAREDLLEFRYPGKVRDYTYVSIDAAGRVCIGGTKPVNILMDQHSEFEDYFSKIPAPSIWWKSEFLRRSLIYSAVGASIFLILVIFSEIFTYLYERVSV